MNKGQTTTNEKPAGIMGGSILASREKYWKELKTGEKIERLRTLLKSLVNENDTLRRELGKFKEHKHNDKGEAVLVKRLVDDYEETLHGNAFGRAYPGAKEDEVYI